MNHLEFVSYFENIVKSNIEDLQEPFNKSDYFDYTKLNWARFSRYFKTKTLSEDLLGIISKIKEPQHWLLITEPWCGDAAHNVPFILMAAAANPLISLSIELRDSEPYSIDKYLTNGTKSIPKLIIRDSDGNDLNTWGPRPVECQNLYTSLKEAQVSSDDLTLQIHTWYNADKGIALQKELGEVISKTL